MIRSNLSLLFRFLLGILLIQGAAAMLAYAALHSARLEVWLLLGVLALITSILTAFWFTSIAGQTRKDALAKVRESFSREREQLRVKAEREKSKVIQQSNKQIARERSRERNKAHFKVGASLAAALGLGVLMLLTQFVTVGLLTLTATGGVLGGYLYRARQERRAHAERPGLAWEGLRRFSVDALAPARAALRRKAGTGDETSGVSGLRRLSGSR